MIYLLAGENNYECEKRLEAILSQSTQVLTPTRLDLSEQDGLETLKTSIYGGSLFDEHETIVVRYIENEKALHERFLKILEDVPESNILIIFMPGAKASNVLVKKISKLADKTFIESNLNEHDLSKWLIRLVENRGGTINMASSRALIDWVGSDQMVLASEIDKLINFNKKISKESIKSIAVPSPRTTIFQMLDAMMQGKVKKATDYLNDLKNQQYDASYIMSMICWQAHIISVAFIGRKDNQTNVAKEAGVSTFVIRKVSRVIQNLDKHDVSMLNKYVLNADYQMKTANVDSQQLVEQLVRRVAFSQVYK